MRKITSMIIGQQKIDYMPLTVVGSPTIVDGVVSGFITRTDYLATTENISVEQLGIKSELCLDVNFNNDSFSLYNIGTNNNLRSFYSKNPNHLVVKIGNSSSYNFVLPNNLNITIYHKFKMVFNNYKCSVYVDNVFIEEHQFEIPTNPTSENVLQIGSEGWVYSAGRAFNGLVNILNSYIILNGIKYKFTLP